MIIDQAAQPARHAHLRAGRPRAAREELHEDRLARPGGALTVAQTMKVKKGDTVRVLRGKDAGKEGRVVEALPKDGRVVVENINVVKRHRRPRPIQNSSAHRRSRDGPRRDHRPAGAAARLERDGRLPDVRQADPRRDRRARRSRTRSCAFASASSAERTSIAHECRSRHLHAAPQGAVRERDPAAAQGRARARLDHAGRRASRRSRSTWASARRRPSRSCSTPPSRS